MAGMIRIAESAGNPIDSVFLLGVSCRPEAAADLLLNPHLYLHVVDS